MICDSIDPLTDRGSSSSCACNFSIIKAYYGPVRFGFSTSIVNGGDFRVALHGIYARGVGTTLRSEIAHFFDAEINFCRFR